MGWLVDKITFLIPRFRVDTTKNKNTDHEVKETSLLYQHKLQRKSTTSLYSKIQLYQAHQIVVFHVFDFYVFNLKEKDHIKRNINSKKRNVYAGNQYYLGLPQIRVGRVYTTKN